MVTKARIIGSRFVISQFTLGGFAFENYFVEVKLRKKCSEDSAQLLGFAQ